MTNTAFSMPFPALNTDAFTKMFAMPDSMGTFARDSIAVGTKSTRASVKGMQDAGSTVMRQLKDHADRSVEAGKKMSEVRSFEDALELQIGYVKSTIDANMKGFTELSDVVSAAFAETFAPVAKQARKAQKPA